MKNFASISYLGISIPSVVLAALVCIGPNLANAGFDTIIATDGFDDGNRTDVTDGINWYSATGFNAEDPPVLQPVMTVVDDTGGLGSGNALRMDPDSTNYEIYGAFPSSVTIPSILSSSISVSFDMRTDVPTGAPLPGGTVRWGIYQYDRDPSVDGFGISDGDYDVGDATNDPSLGAGGDVGTWIQMNGDDGGFGPSGNLTRLRTENNSDDIPGNNLVIFGGPDVETVAAPLDNQDPPQIRPFPEMTGSKTSMEMIVTRVGNAGDDTDFLHTFNITTPSGSDSISGREPGAPEIPNSTTDTFDYLMIFHSGATPWIVDNLVVKTFTAPEPATWILLSLTGLVFCARPRKK